MTKEKTNKNWAIIIFIFSLFLPFASVSAGTVLSAYKYAWSNNLGYINFENVIVNDNTLLGYAWSVNSGYINFAPAQGGVLNDGNGNLSGSAWGTGVGWIDFDDVTINPPVGATRKFSGTATGSLVGTINFDCGFCDVRTDWQTVTLLPSTSSSGSFLNTEEVLVNPNIPVIPNTENPPVEPPDLPPAGGGNVPTTSLTASTASTGAPLFDVVSEPLLVPQKGFISFIILSIIAWTLILLIGVYLKKWFFFIRAPLRIAYYNGTEIVDREQNLSKIVEKQFNNFKTVSLFHASRTDYDRTLIVDFTGKHGRESKKIAKFLHGIVASLPRGEVQPNADILIISGKS